ncbi:MAG: hypothetical protein OXG62_14790 [Nitrospinae bacterium]|nr:hypothetical protein [Nitrospinota bacterium]
MNIELQLQIISILMAVIGVALPSLIAIAGFVYVRRITERMDNLSDQTEELKDHIARLWNRVGESQT